MNKFICQVITPEGKVYDGSILSASVPLQDGLIGILANRAPMMAVLGNGALTLKTDEGAVMLLVSGGFMEVRDNVLTILADEVSRIVEPTEGKSDSEYQRARKELGLS